MRKEMRIIFLDVCGLMDLKTVLEEKYDTLSEYITDDSLKRLSKLYHKYEDTGLVLTPLHKNDLDYTDLTNKFKEYDIDIFDVTPDLYDTRPKQIIEWMACNGNIYVTDWVSIDHKYNEEDYEAVKDGFENHLVKPISGLTNNTYHVALEILGGCLD